MIALRPATTDSVSTYYQWCDAYRCTPHAPVVLALRFPGAYLQLEKPFGQGDLIPLVEALKDNVTVTAVDFRRCCIGSPGCYALKELLTCNQTIKMLNLCNNDIGEHGAVALAEGTPCGIGIAVGNSRERVKRNEGGLVTATTGTGCTFAPARARRSA